MFIFFSDMFLCLYCRCWITDNVVQWTVNVGYYALVFLFTLTAFIIISSQLLCTAKMGSALIGRNGTRITIVLGLCCIQGIAWGFIFFAHGVLRIPAYYIFTVLSSFQGIQRWCGQKDEIQQVLFNLFSINHNLMLTFCWCLSVSHKISVF